MTGSSPDKFSVVIVGTGAMGTRWAKVIGFHGRCRLAALVDPDLSKAETLMKIIGSSVPIFSDLRSALERLMVEAVVIATPHVFLAPLSEQALSLGKNVLCEKPGAINARQLKKNWQLAQKKRLRFMIAFNHRFHPAIITAKKLFDRKDIGPLLFIRGRYGHGGRKGYDQEWRASKALGGGGELLDQGIHLIDLTRWFMGEPKEIRSFLTTNFWKIKPLEDNAFILFKGDNDVIVHLHVSWTQWKNLFSWEVYGEKGYLSVEGLGGKYGRERLLIGKRGRDFSVSEKKIEFRNPARIDPDDSLYDLWEEFISAIEEERDPVPGVYEGWQALALVDKIYRQSQPQKNLWRAKKY